MKKFFKIETDGSVNHIDSPTLCSFGLTEGLGVLIAGGLGSLGVGAATAGGIGSALATGIGGSLLGGGISALTGGSFGKGALAGGIGGLAMGALGQVVPGLGTPSAGGVQPSAGGAAPAASDGWGSGTSALGQSAGAAGSQAAGATSLAKYLPATISALGAIGSLLNRPQTPSVQMPPGFNAPWNPTGYLNRSFNSNVMPASGNWQTYGEGPEQSFYNNNQVTFPNTGWPPPPPGHAQGGAISRYADGGQFVPAQGDFYVGGSAGGQDDTQPARLSDGEVVFDAGTVSAIGDGNNAAGARRLLAMRKQIAQDKGFKHTVQPKLKKDPISYLKDARR